MRVSSLGVLRSLSTLGLLLMSISWLGSSAANSASVTRIVDNGPSGNRVDVVILGDGYTSAQMAKFDADAAKLVRYFRSQEPFKSWSTSFNFSRVNTPSVESGAGYGYSKNTVYGSYYNCYGIDRLLCADDALVAGILDENIASDGKDIVFLLVNDKRYGGSGGAYAVASTNAASLKVAMHELGHSFGYLDDEYVDPPLCGFYTDPWGINVASTSQRDSLPWKAWINDATTLPTPPRSKKLVGAFEGAFYCTNGWYRPTANSTMRTLGSPFREVNSEALILRTYETVSLLDGAYPLPGPTAITSGSASTFNVNIANAGTALVSITWRLDGTLIGSGPALTLSGDMLSTSPQVLEAIVRAQTPKVRTDSGSQMIDTVSWTVFKN